MIVFCIFEQFFKLIKNIIFSKLKSINTERISIFKIRLLFVIGI